MTEKLSSNLQVTGNNIVKKKKKTQGQTRSTQTLGSCRSSTSTAVASASSLLFSLNLLAALVLKDQLFEDVDDFGNG